MAKVTKSFIISNNVDVFKVLEEEMNNVRKKLLEKERECERLNTELTLTQKKPKILQKSK